MSRSNNGRQKNKYGSAIGSKRKSSARERLSLSHSAFGCTPDTNGGELLESSSDDDDDDGGQLVESSSDDDDDDGDNQKPAADFALHLGDNENGGGDQSSYSDNSFVRLGFSEPLHSGADDNEDDSESESSCESSDHDKDNMSLSSANQSSQPHVSSSSSSSFIGPRRNKCRAARLNPQRSNLGDDSSDGEFDSEGEDECDESVSGKFQDYVVRLSEKSVIFCFFVWCRT